MDQFLPPTDPMAADPLAMGGGIPPAPPPPLDPSGGDPLALIAMLERVVGPVAGTSPIYPKNFKKPPKPDAKGLFGRGLHWRERYGLALEEMENNLDWLDGVIQGMFDEDIEKAEAGLTVAKWPLKTMIAEWDMICAFISGLPFAVDKPVYDETRKVEVNQIKEAVAFLRRIEVDRHADKGNGLLPMDEARMFTEFGQLINRSVVNLDDPDFPFDSSLISPLEVFPEWGGASGLRRVWRVYDTTCSRLFGDYGEPPKSEMKKLRNSKGNDVDDDTVITVVEYWDQWYRSVIATEGTVIVPVKAHEYGYVPYTIQYGPLGQPMAVNGRGTRHHGRRQRSGEVVSSDAHLRDDLIYKSVSYIHTMKGAHAQLEALASRLVTGVMKQVNPPVIRSRDDVAAEKPLEAVDTGPDGTTELMRGHEDLLPIPTAPSSIELGAVMDLLGQEMSILRAPMSMFGLNDRSNVSGTAINSLTDAGMEKVSPWIAALERYHSRRFGQWLLSYRNFGHLARYGSGGGKTPFMVPSRRPRRGDQPSFELTPDLIDRAGTKVEVILRRVRQADLLPFLNASNLGNQLGVMTREQIARELGDTDWDRTFEEWTEEQMVFQAIQRPEFAEIFGVPMAIMAEMKEAQGDPAKVAYLQQMLDEWKARFAQPPPQQGAQPGAPGQMPPGGEPPLALPPGGPQGASQPGMAGVTSTAGMPTAQMGMAPGTQGGPVGRPGGVILDQNGMPIPSSSARIG